MQTVFGICEALKFIFEVHIRKTTYRYTQQKQSSLVCLQKHFDKLGRIISSLFM